MARPDIYTAIYESGDSKTFKCKTLLEVFDSLHHQWSTSGSGSDSPKILYLNGHVIVDKDLPIKIYEWGKFYSESWNRHQQEIIDKAVSFTKPLPTQEKN